MFNKKKNQIKSIQNELLFLKARATYLDERFTKFLQDTIVKDLKLIKSQLAIKSSTDPLEKEMDKFDQSLAKQRREKYMRSHSNPLWIWSNNKNDLF